MLVYTGFTILYAVGPSSIVSIPRITQLYGFHTKVYSADREIIQNIYSQGLSVVLIIYTLCNHSYDRPWWSQENSGGLRCSSRTVMADMGVRCGAFLKLWVWNHMLHTCPVLGIIMALNLEKPNPSWSRGIRRFEGKKQILIPWKPWNKAECGNKIRGNPKVLRKLLEGSWLVKAQPSRQKLLENVEDSLWSI